MIRPFNIATDGYLCNTLSIATNGYLCPAEDNVVEEGGGGFSEVINEVLSDRIIKEDEEIITIIKAFLECL